MCGITALIDWKKSNPLCERICQTMTRELAHRGNDGEGFFTSKKKCCFLGHRRLSILDTSAAGQQPMSSHDKRYTLSYNGEIYNFKELKHELSSQGVSFISNSDTEVLLAGFMIHGPTIFKKLRGMFAGALWDEATETLTVFRDHLGIKPLYWWNKENHFACSSELQALLKHPEIAQTLDLEAINEYQIAGSIHAPKTIFKDIYALEPGHYLHITKNNVEKVKYWDINALQTNIDLSLSPHDVEKKVHELIQDSVQHHLISDIPVGLFLSGGLDSSCIAACVKEATDASMHSFSIGFDSDGTNIDESSAAAHISSFLGMKHSTIRCTKEDFEESFEHFIAHLDQPSTDGFNSFLVSKATANSVHVALSGLGGDELFLGYRYHQELARWTSHKNDLFFPAYKALATAAHQNKCINKLVYHSPLRGIDQLYHATDPWKYLATRSITNKTITPATLVQEPWYQNHAESLLSTIFKTEPDLLNAYSKAELSWYTPGTLLRDADVTGMAFTLEVRFPFLDIPLVNYLLSLPSKYKINPHGPTKVLLRSIVEKMIPSSLLDPQKKGFEMPIGHWLLAYPKLYKSILDAPFLDKLEAQKLIYAFEKKPSQYLPLWQSLILHQWMKQNNRLEAS